MIKRKRKEKVVTCVVSASYQESQQKTLVLKLDWSAISTTCNLYLNLVNSQPSATYLRPPPLSPPSPLSPFSPFSPSAAPPSPTPHISKSKQKEQQYVGIKPAKEPVLPHPLCPHLPLLPHLLQRLAAANSGGGSSERPSF